MNGHQIKNSYIESFKTGRLGQKPGVMNIPIQFVPDLPLSFQIRIQPQSPMSPVLRYTMEKPLMPALFQIAACADDVKSLSELRNALILGSVPPAEMLSDPQKLEDVLKTIAKKKRPAPRRASPSRTYKNLA